jgi:putative SOS response-associated peptidase YedK
MLGQLLGDSNSLEWVSGEEIEHALSLLRPFPAELMDGYDVSKLVNSPLNDTPDCIAPA